MPTKLITVLIVTTIASAARPSSDLAWVDEPRAWHQQLARIVDHRFLTFDRLESFARKAKLAGVSVLMLVQIQKTEACPGPWYNGLQLCDHINGSNPAADGTLGQWQALVQELKPMRLMWWMNPTYVSVQGQIWAQAKADKLSAVGQFFTWNVTDADGCWGFNPAGGGVKAQGSWGGDGAFAGVESAMATFGSPSFADYLVDAFANSWTRNLGIDGYTIDVSANYPRDPSSKECPSGMLQCDGDSLVAWSKIVDRVREQQPQVVLSGEYYANWKDVYRANSDMGGQGFPELHEVTQAAVVAGDLSEVEDTVARTGADGASVLCYLTAEYDGVQPGRCPTMYFRDSTVVLKDLKQHQMWVALEAAGGIVPEHDYDPESYCLEGAGGYNGCLDASNPGAWWNVTSDPFDAAAESPLWAFTKHRALNRLALRTKLSVRGSVRSSVRGSVRGRSDAAHNYTLYKHSNCYGGHGGVEIDSDPIPGLSDAQCKGRCDATTGCDCVVVCADGSGGGCAVGDCWRRAACEPAHFEVDGAASPYSVHVQQRGPSPPPPPPTGGALAYLKHDAMGPRGDAAILLFNPGAAQDVTVDLGALLPASMLGGAIVPYDLLGANSSSADAAPAAAAVPALSAQWTIPMRAGEMKFFGGFGLSVFAPRRGKKGHCVADDGYTKAAAASTLQGCFLQCLADAKCENVVVEHVDIVWMEIPPDLRCTLLGSLADPSHGCTEGTATLVTKLPGVRPLE